MKKLTTALVLSALALGIGACKDEPAKSNAGTTATESRSEVTGSAATTPAPRGADGMDGSGRNGGRGGTGGASVSGGRGGAGGKGGDSD